MKGPTLVLALTALVLAIGCENPQQPDGRPSVADPSKIISDGAHGGNKDFFFLPPLVPLPRNNPDFELGKFNNALGPSLKIEICELNSDNLKPAPAPLTGMLPTEATTCGATKKTFAPGTVQLVNLPLRQNGWWSLLGLPPDGFYYVLWDTRQSNLNVNKYYRIKVFIDGNPAPLGIADVDPMANLFQWKYSLTGEVIQMVDDVLLPIPFRVEKGGGSTLCGAATNCASATITNNSTTGTQSVIVDAGGGSIAGAKFPNGWLPSGTQCPSTGSCPQSVVVTITEVNLGEGGVCHPGIPFQQFRGCFNYSTTPSLQPINEAGDQFTQPVTVAVCFELEGSGDPREKFAELYASGPGEPTHALEDVSDGGLLGVTTKDCSAPPVITSNGSNPLMQFASNEWRKLKGGLSRVFGVQTAYAVDLGLGGIVKGFSHIGPVVPAQLVVEGPTDLGVQPGGTRYILNVMMMGSDHHGTHLAGGIGGLPVTFTVSSTAQGTVEQHFTAVGAVTPTSVESITRNDSETRGEASAIWHLPSTPGTYQLTVNGPSTDAPATFTATVVADQRMLSMQTGATYQLSVSEPDVVASWVSSAPTRIQVSANGLATAIVGGENSNGGDDATVTSVLTSGAPGPVWLVDTPFTIFPRVTTAAWVPVAGAASYDVEVEFGNGCTGYANCTTWSPHVGGTGLSPSSSSFTFTFVGTQPGRWRVIARDVTGAPMPGSPSSWIFFRYIDGL